MFPLLISANLQHQGILRISKIGFRPKIVLVHQYFSEQLFLKIQQNTHEIFMVVYFFSKVVNFALCIDLVLICFLGSTYYHINFEELFKRSLTAKVGCIATKHEKPWGNFDFSGLLDLCILRQFHSPFKTTCRQMVS